MFLGVRLVFAAFGVAHTSTHHKNKKSFPQLTAMLAYAKINM
jgi:hypothetical protein